MAASERTRAGEGVVRELVGGGRALGLPCLWLLLASVASGCASGADYVAPPESSDPWELIEHARGALQRGRPRAALPSLRKADVEAEKVDRSTPAYTHVKAAICNELGRVYLMAGDLDTAEAEFLRCIPLAESLQQRRPLHFDIAYNASTLYEAKATRVESLASWKAHKRDPLAKWRTSASLRASGSVIPGTHSSEAGVLASESCTHLRRAAELHRHLVAVPAEPPDGWGADGERIGPMADRMIGARAQRLACDLDGPSEGSPLRSP